MIFRILGDVEIGSDSNAPIKLPERRFLGVLIALLIRANKTVTTGQLIEAGWGANATVKKPQVHKAVSAIRTILDTVQVDGAALDLVLGNYVLRLPFDQLDLLQFGVHLDAAEVARGVGDIEGEISRRRAALDLWRGDPWANLSDLYPGEAERLADQRRLAVTRLVELELGRGNHDGALAQLTKVAEQCRDRRRLTELLMAARFLAGDRVGALDAFDEHEAALEERWAAEPQSSTTELKFAIARGDEAAVEAFVGSRRPPPPADLGRAVGIPQELPPVPTGFVGRDNVTNEAAFVWSREDPAARTLVISGPPGIGKTTLAKHIASQHISRFPDGQLFVELYGASDRPASSYEVVGQLLRALHVGPVPESSAERVANYRSILADRRVLVVLDDARDEAQVRDLIPGSASSGVLITARQPLPGIDGAHPLPPLDRLDLEQSMAMFQRALAPAKVAVDPRDEDTKRVVELCAGLPLAIRIVAAIRVRDALAGRPISSLAERLADQDPEQFTYGDRSLAVTLGTAIDRLDEPSRQLLLKLALLDLQEVSEWLAVALLGETMPDALTELIWRQLLQPTADGNSHGMHELTREYAARRARNVYPADQIRSEVFERAYVALLTLCRRAHRGMYGGDFEVVHSDIPDWPAPPSLLTQVDVAGRGWFTAQRGNIRAAISHCAELDLVDLCWDLAITVHEFYAIAVDTDDWYATHTVALAACQRTGNKRGEGVMLAALGQPTLVASRPGTVSGPTELQRALSLLTECKDRHGQAIAARTLANALRRRGQLHRPLTLFQEALSNYEHSRDPIGAQQTLRYIGQTYQDLRKPEDALRALAHALQIAVDRTDDRLQAQTHYWTGQVHLTDQNWERARTSFVEVRALVGSDEGLGASYARHGLGQAALGIGDLDAANRHLSRSLELARTSHDQILQGRVLLAVADLHRARREPDREATALTEAVDCFAGCSSPFLEAEAWAALARRYDGLGNATEAAVAWQQVARLYVEMALPPEDLFRQPGPTN